MTLALSAHRPAARSVSLLTRLSTAIAVTRQRKRLAELEDHLLADIGVSREDAKMEAARAPWDAPWNAPSHWRI